jgi:hypothetical protein
MHVTLDLCAMWRGEEKRARADGAVVVAVQYTYVVMEEGDS